MYFVYVKLPKRIQRFLEKHMLLTEIVSSLMTYWLFGGTITALFAAAWLGIIQSIIFLMLANKDARYVLDACMLRLGKITNSAKEWNVCR